MEQIHPWNWHSKFLAERCKEGPWHSKQSWECVMKHSCRASFSWVELGWNWERCLASLHQKQKYQTPSLILVYPVQYKCLKTLMEWNRLWVSVKPGLAFHFHVFPSSLERGGVLRGLGTSPFLWDGPPHESGGSERRQLDALTQGPVLFLLVLFFSTLVISLEGVVYKQL